MSLQIRLSALAAAVGADIKTLKAAQGTLAIEPWHYVGGAGEPAFQNQWKNYDNDATIPSANPVHRSLRFRKDPFGIVRMSGCIKSSTPANVGVFYLPPTHRPVSSDNNFIANCSGGVAGISLRMADGLVYVNAIGTSTPGAFMFFDEVEFDTESVTQVLSGGQGPKGDPGGVLGANTFRQTGALVVPAAASGWRTVPINYGSESTPTDAFTRNGDGSVTIRDAGWYSVSGTYWNAGAVSAISTFAFTDTVNNVGNPMVSDTDAVASNYSHSVAANGYFAAGAKIYANLWTDVSTPFAITSFTIVRLGGTQGPKGDTGGVSVVETLNWNTALTPNFYNSTSDIFSTTINGPGDTLNPPRQAGIVAAHANGALSQRVWDLDQQVSYTRFRTGGGVWTAWKSDLLLPPLLTAQIVGAPDPKDGDERYFQNAAMLAAGVMWKFRYNSSDSTAYKWQFVGGTKYTAGPSGDITTASSAAVALTGGPTMTIPLDGYYEASIGATLIANAAPSGYATASIYKDAADAGLPISFVFQTQSGQTVEPFKENILFLTSGQVMSVKVSCANAQSNRFVNARIGFRPVRVLM